MRKAGPLYEGKLEGLNCAALVGIDLTRDVGEMTWVRELC